MKAPAFQFYAQDFLTGCVYLTNEETGMYIKMLCKQWTDGKIPVKRLEFLVGKKWDELSEDLKEKFEFDGEFLHNKRLEIERKKQQEKSEKAKKSADKRWKKTPETLENKGEIKKMPTHKKRISESDAFLEDRNMKNEEEDEIEKEIKIKNEKNENFGKKLFQTQSWVETILMQNKISVDELKEMISEFNIKLSNEFDFKYSKQLYASHFSRWLTVELSKKRNKNIKTNSESFAKNR